FFIRMGSDHGLNHGFLPMSGKYKLQPDLFHLFPSPSRLPEEGPGPLPRPEAPGPGGNIAAFAVFPEVSRSGVKNGLSEGLQMGWGYEHRDFSQAVFHGTQGTTVLQSQLIGQFIIDSSP